MKISNLNKKELVDYMKASKEIHRFNYDNPAWKRAAKLYRDSGQPFDEDCSGCISRLKEWLQKL